MNAKAKLENRKAEKRALNFPRLRTAAQGLTLGFGDEIEAAMRNPGLLLGLESSKQEYADDLADARRSIAGFRESNPVQSAALEMGGALIPSLLPFGFLGTGARAGSLLGRMGRGAGIGAAEGGIYGMGTQEGGLLDRNPLNTEAAVGGGVGAFIPGVGAVGASAINRMRDPLNRAQRSFRNLLGPGKDNTTLGRMLAERNPDKPQVAADLMGANAQSRVGALSGMSGPQREQLNQGLQARQIGQAERAISDIETTSGIPLKNTEEAVDDLSRQRAAQARPLYEAAYEAGSEINDPAITTLINKPDFRSAYNKGKIIYDAENSARILRQQEPLPELGDLPEGAVSFNLRGLDNIYRGMRTQADKAYRDGESELGKALKDQANALRDRLDELVPEYGKARSVFKSDSEMIEAMQLGQQFMAPGRIGRNSRTLKKELEGLDEGQLEAYRMGAIDAVRQEIAKGAKEGTNIRTRFFGTKEMRDRLRLLYPDGAEGDSQFNALINRLNQEDQMQQTLKKTYGARTAPMQEEIKDQIADEGGANVSRGDVQRGLFSPINAAADYVYGGIANTIREGSPRVRQEMADLLMDPVLGGVGKNNMPVLSPRMQQFQQNLTRSNQNAQQLRGLLDRFAVPAGAAGGLMGSIYSNRQ
tara:strand:+ start:1212 stop:3149 length:1938 start_codon:yes stop_codon:yes gene_type:complete